MTVSLVSAFSLFSNSLFLSFPPASPSLFFLFFHSRCVFPLTLSRSVFFCPLPPIALCIFSPSLCISLYLSVFSLHPSLSTLLFTLTPLLSISILLSFSLSQSEKITVRNNETCYCERYICYLSLSHWDHICIEKDLSPECKKKERNMIIFSKNPFAMVIHEMNVIDSQPARWWNWGMLNIGGLLNITLKQKPNLLKWW